MLRSLLVALGIVVATILAGAVAVWWSLRPPSPLAVPPRDTVIPAVTVVEPGIGRSEDVTVVVRDGLIADVRPATAEERAGRNAEHFALPGLVDMHVHFPPLPGIGQTEHFALLFLLHGVTTVRDAGDILGNGTGPAREGIGAGDFPGPRVFACGPFVDGPGGGRWPNTETVDTPAEAAAVVERIAAAGYDCVKAYDELSADALAAVRKAAGARDLPVIGHVPYSVSFEEARLDDVQHLTGIVRAPDKRFPYNIALWPELSEEHAGSVVRAAVEHDIAVTPTFITRDRFWHWTDPDMLAWAPDAALLPRVIREVVWQTPPWEKAVFETFRESFPHEARLVRRLHDAGARVHLGTDSLAVVVVPGSSMHREMRLFEAAGFTPEETWTLATRTAGQSLGLPGLGRLRPGSPADLLVYGADPTRDLDHLESLVQVVADGRAYSFADLEAQLARNRAHFEGAIFDGVLTALVERIVSQTLGDAPPDPAD